MAFEYSMYDLSGQLTDADHYLVVAKVKEKLVASKQEAQKFNVERFKFRKLNQLEFRKQYQIKISNRFAALENFSDSEDVKMV